MSYEHLYKPEPCSAWPTHELRAVGIAYREAAGDGLSWQPCLDRAIAAYVAAGGREQGAARAVQDMIASLSREQGDWLWGPAQAFRDRQRPELEEGDPFLQPGDLA